MPVVESASGVSHRGETVARSTVFALAAQLTTAAFTAALTVYLVRTLGPSGFGTFSLALGIGLVLVLPADFGISASAARFAAEHRSDRAAVAAVLASALRLKLLSGGIVAAALFALAGSIADAYGAPELTWPLRAMAVALFGQSLFQLPRITFIALRRVPVTFRLVLSESAMEFTATVALVTAAGGATAALFGRATGYVLGAAIGIAVVFRIVGLAGKLRNADSPIPARRLVGYAGSLFIIDGAFAVFSQIDVLIIGAILGTASAGLFAAPLRLLTLLNYPGLAVAQGVGPRLARERGAEPDRTGFQRALRVLVILQAALTAVVVAWAEPIVSVVLGAEFRESADVLRALAPAVFLSGLAPLVSVSLNYLGEARRRVPIALATVVLNVAIDVSLVPVIGIVAGAIGTGAAYAAYVGGHLWVCRRVLAIRLAPLALSGGRAIVAGAAAAGCLVLIGTDDLSLIQSIAGPPLAALAFVLVLVLSREVSLLELRSLASRLRSRLASVRARRRAATGAED